MKQTAKWILTSTGYSEAYIWGLTIAWGMRSSKLKWLRHRWYIQAIPIASGWGWRRARSVQNLRHILALPYLMFQCWDLSTRTGDRQTSPVLETGLRDIATGWWCSIKSMGKCETRSSNVASSGRNQRNDARTRKAPALFEARTTLTCPSIWFTIVP